MPQVMLILSLEEVALLPPELIARFRDRIFPQTAAVALPQQQYQPPQQQYQPQQLAPPPAADLPPGFQPYAGPTSKRPVQTGPTSQVFRPDTNQLPQVSTTKDVLTGAGSAGPPVNAAPSVPQFSNAPVTVGPIPMQSAPAPQQMTLDRATVQRYAVQIRTQDKRILDKAIATSQIGGLGNLTEENAGLFYQHLAHAVKGGV